MVKTPCFHCRGHGFDPLVGELRTPRDAWRGKKKKKEGELVQALNRSNANSKYQWVTFTVYKVV